MEGGGFQQSKLSRKQRKAVDRKSSKYEPFHFLPIQTRPIADVSQIEEIQIERNIQQVL